MDGNQLINELIQATGLPKEWAESRLKNIIEATGQSSDSLNMEALREILAAFLQETLLEVKAELTE